MCVQYITLMLVVWAVTVAVGVLGETVVVGHATLPIDHHDTSMGTYQNRYWVNDQYYRPGGPVFVHDVGESNAEHTAHRYLGDSSSYMVDFLREFHGVGIAWEHRYFGNSLPFPVNLTTPFEQFKYLTTSQALEDIPAFAQTFRHPHAGLDLSPRTTPWVIIGCSYSGARAAFSRDKHPETFHAAYAASPTVEAKNNDIMYFQQVYRGMIGYGYANCTRNLREIVQYVDNQLSSGPQNASAIKRLFFGPGAEYNTHEDFASALATIYSGFQGRGMTMKNPILPKLCDYLEHNLETGDSALARELVLKLGSEALTQRFASWAPLIGIINESYRTNCAGKNISVPLSCDLSQSRYPDPALISWTWMLCSEWGTGVGPNPMPDSIVSKYIISHDGRNSVCNVQFPGAIDAGALPPQPETNQLNWATGGRHVHPSNTFWTVGEFDPWRSVTPLSGTRTGEANATKYVLPHAEHCYDFRTTSPSARIARKLFVHNLRVWLSEWRPM
ncbi:hypothetical protein N7463_009277 [Penicillium fimorum]|uniref:Peptidase S28 n=1 Tax=Penicillium fimorum TaxID=1882269 RepID=A0A9X0C4J5_9EURO|nr:hypothetical protein N7463_009277 [Penicillium fimorum]